VRLMQHDAVQALLGHKKPGRYVSGRVTRVPGLLAIYLTWLQAGRLK
jgi:hypothetical protein